MYKYAAVDACAARTLSGSFLYGKAVNHYSEDEFILFKLKVDVAIELLIPVRYTVTCTVGF